MFQGFSAIDSAKGTRRSPDGLHATSSSPGRWPDPTLDALAIVRNPRDGRQESSDRIGFTVLLG